MFAGADLVLETLQLIKVDNVVTNKQPNLEEKTAYKLFPDNCKIDWSESLENIYNKIRGLNPYPAAWTTIYNNDTEVTAKLYGVSKEFINHSDKNGKILTTKKTLKVSVQDGYLIINEIKLSGKKKMEVQNLLNGYQFSFDSKMS